MNKKQLCNTISSIAYYMLEDSSYTVNTSEITVDNALSWYEHNKGWYSDHPVPSARKARREAILYLRVKDKKSLLVDLIKELNNE